MSADEINLSSLDLTVKQRGRGDEIFRLNKTAILVIVGVFILAVMGGGSYYYHSIYRPKIYLRAIVPLYERADLLGSETAPKSTTQETPLAPLDYAGAAERIRAREQTLNTSRAEIINIEPPNAMLRVFHGSLLEVLELAARVSMETRERAQFFAQLLTLKTELGALRAIVSTPQQHIRTVGDLKETWLPHLRAARTTGTKAFTDEVRTWGTGDAAVAAVITLWYETAPGIDFLIETLGAFQNNVRVEEFGTLLTPAQSTQGEKSFRNIEHLIEAIGELATMRSAHSLLDPSTVTGETQAAFSEKSYQTYRELEELKRRYVR